MNTIMKKIAQKESEIQASFIQEMELRGAVVIKINNVGIRKPNGSYIPPRQVGIADVIVCYKGRFIAVEFKRPGKNPTVFQLAFLNQVIDAGGIAFGADDAGKAVKYILEVVK